VDDDLMVSRTFARILALAGYEVSVAHSADAGLERASAAPPDAIVLDLRMPTAGGLTFLLRLRQDNRLRDLPVAVVTGDRFMGQQAEDELRALGVTIHYKPLGMDDLLTLVRSLLSREAS
jgi:CheY-like chemotaxis protein